MAVDQISVKEEFPNAAQIAAESENCSSLHPRFVIPEERRIKASFCEESAKLQPPLIDLALLNSHKAEDRAFLQKCISDSCRDDGFFQVVNHGVPMEIIRKVEDFGREFFALSVEEKERSQLGLYSGYDGRHKQFADPAPWAESFNVHYSPFTNMEELANLVSPHDTHSFRCVFSNYGSAMRDLSDRLLKLLARTLGLQESTYVSKFQTYTAAMHIHHYPPCPWPDLAQGSGPHTDPNCLTILYQDSVGGLQIEKSTGKWVQIKPVADAFVVNIGDIFQAWSNGLYKSTLHRVVLNPHKSRFSIGYFYSPQYDTSIAVPDELVSADNPLKYRSFTCAEFYTFISQNGLYNRWQRALERFASTGASIPAQE